MYLSDFSRAEKVKWDGLTTIPISKINRVYNVTFLFYEDETSCHIQCRQVVPYLPGSDYILQ